MPCGAEGVLTRECLFGWAGARIAFIAPVSHQERPSGRYWTADHIPAPLDNARAVASLLIYCLSDCLSEEATSKDTVRGMQGCMLLPLQDGSVAAVPPSDTPHPLLLDTDAFNPADHSQQVPPVGARLARTCVRGASTMAASKGDGC